MLRGWGFVSNLIGKRTFLTSHVLFTAVCGVLPLSAPLTPLTVGRGTLI